MTMTKLLNTISEKQLNKAILLSEIKYPIKAGKFVIGFEYLRKYKLNNKIINGYDVVYY